MADPHEYRVLASGRCTRARSSRCYRERVAMPGGGDSVRDIVRHPGAVAVVALDEQDRVVLVRQYRHAFAEHLWELPAGLRDADGEPPLETARRELAEEALLAAGQWSLLATNYSSPGFSDEVVLIYLAEGLTDAERPRGSSSSTRRRTWPSSGCRCTRRCSGCSTAGSATPRRDRSCSRRRRRAAAASVSGLPTETEPGGRPSLPQAGRRV